ncbi:MAG TPA: hypothetical protein PLV92_00055, partial [Pirellulaceae bacterium]|nr:hypothetical protein [Pirellulaceae bacterium]
MDAQQLRRRKILLLGFVLIAGGAVGGMFFKALRDVRQAAIKPSGQFDLSSIRLPKPPPPPQGFVGSDACTECHEEIAAKYARHPMGRSLNTLAGAEPLEDYGGGSVEFQPPGHRRYRVERQGDDIIHHEVLLDEAGDKIYDQSVRIRFVLGSGQHGRSYLIDRGGVLYQSSIGWFRDGG